MHTIWPAPITPKLLTSAAAAKVALTLKERRQTILARLLILFVGRNINDILIGELL